MCHGNKFTLTRFRGSSPDVHRDYVYGSYISAGGHLDLRIVTIFTNFQFPFNTRLHIKFEEIWPRDRVSEECPNYWKIYIGNIGLKNIGKF